MVLLLERVLRVCASLKLAVALILLCAGVLAFGTVYEARYGSAAAREVVYDGWPLSLVFGGIAVNVMAAVVVRYPWKRKHAGFIVTHIGLEILLLGCLISQRQAVDGAVAIREGEAVGAVVLNGTVGRVYPLPFELGVESAKGVETARGLDGLETVVRVEQGGRVRRQTVRLNEPLTVDGVTFYQTGFQGRADGNVAVLGMRKDPGWRVKMAGCLGVVGGIVTMFGTGAYSKKTVEARVERELAVVA